MEAIKGHFRPLFLVSPSLPCGPSTFCYGGKHRYVFLYELLSFSNVDVFDKNKAS